MVSFIRANTKKMSMERKWTNRQCHAQYNAAVSHKDVKIYCNTNQFPALTFCGPYSKPHGARGLSKHYNLSFGTKLGDGVCAIFRITCDCVACTSILYKPWISSIPLDEHERYKLVTKCTFGEY